MDFECNCWWSADKHPNWGACQRSKNLKIAYANSADGKDYTQQKKWDRDLEAYASARAEGIQPAGTKRGHVEAAKILSDQMGSAFQAG